MAPVKGLSIASFPTPGHVVYIVSDLDDPAFRQVAESLAESRVAALGDVFIRVVSAESVR